MWELKLLRKKDMFYLVFKVIGTRYDHCVSVESTLIIFIILLLCGYNLLQTKLKDLKDCIEKLNKEKCDLLTQYRKVSRFTCILMMGM